MTKVIFYDTSDSDVAQIGQYLGQATPAKFVSDPLTADSLDPEAEVISVFVNSQVTADLIASMPKLRLIACRSTGFNNVDLAAATKAGVTVVNVPSYGESTVAEYAFGLILALTRRIPQAIEALRQGQTDHEALMGRDIQGKTLGIVGAGRIGCYAAKIARGFDMEILAYDPHPDPARAKQHGFKYADLDEVLAAADIISLHVPFTPSTRHLINNETLKLVKPTALLVNTSRGEIIDTKALVGALREKRLAGVALDVFEGEALVEIDEELQILRAQQVDRMVLEQGLELDILRKLPNVIMTNHNAFNSAEAVGRINQTTTQNIQAFLDGKPQNQVQAP